MSHVARYPDQADSLALVGLLQNGDYRLGLSLLHLQELSAPTFASRQSVGSFLETIPVSWAPSPDVLFQREVRWGIERALYGSNSSPEVFDTSFEKAMGAPPEASIPISEMLQALAERPDLRAHLREAAHYGADADSRFKRTAALVRAPNEPILSHIRDMRMSSMRSGITIPQTVSDEDIFRKAGCLAGFPANYVAQALAKIRSMNETFRTESNDVIDEWHACYAPYCAVTVLDRATAARFREARLPDASRVTHRLSDVRDILERS